MIDRWIDITKIDQHTGELLGDTIHTNDLPTAEFPDKHDHETGEVTYETLPDTRGYLPVVNERRARRGTYRPYKTGSDLWRHAANQRLQAISQRKWQRD